MSKKKKKKTLNEQFCGLSRMIFHKIPTPCAWHLKCKSRLLNVFLSWQINWGAGEFPPPQLSPSKRDANGGKRGYRRYRCKIERGGKGREKESVCVCVWGVSMATCQGCVCSPEMVRERRGGERDERRGENYPLLRVRGGWEKEIMEGRGEGGIVSPHPPHATSYCLFFSSPLPHPCCVLFVGSLTPPPLFIWK